LSQPEGAPGPGRGDSGQPFGKDAARAVAIAAELLAHAELQTYTIMRPGQVGEGTSVVTMDAPRWRGTERTRCRGLERAHGEGELGGGLIDTPGVEVQ
jgi:hypothetical protein